MSRPVLIILISAFVMLGPFTNNIMVPSLTSIATEMQTGFGDAQTILSIFMVGFATGQLFVGPMSGGFGRKPVLTVSMALFVATSVLFGDFYKVFNFSLAPVAGILRLARHQVSIEVRVRILIQHPLCVFAR